MESRPSIKSILLLDSEGDRIQVAYYSDDWPTDREKKAFEKALFTKTQNTNARTKAEITMFENNIVVYKFVQDLHFFVTGGKDENDQILLSVLDGFFYALAILLRGNVQEKEVLENLHFIVNCLDEMIDGGGFILQTDAIVIALKVAGAPSSPRESLHSIKNIFLLDSEGECIVAEYYSDDWPTYIAKKVFENAVFTKTRRIDYRTKVLFSGAEITMFGNNIVAYKSVEDLRFFVTGGKDENVDILLSVLECFFDAVGILLRGNVEKKEAIENLDFILNCPNKMIDDRGFILETDANVIALQVAGAPLHVQESRPSIKNILLLDSEGERIVAEYYSDDWQTIFQMKAFEKDVFTKTRQANTRYNGSIEYFSGTEITMFENNVVVYKFVRDLHFFVTGGKDENVHILLSVLEGFFDAVGILLRGNVEKKEAVENLAFILNCADEMIDEGGFILQTDANVIALNVAGAPLSPQVKRIKLVTDESS